MVEAIILDFDDTLCMTEEACFEMENNVLQAMGRQLMSRELHKATWGKPLFEVISERSPGIDVVAFQEAYTPIIKQFTDKGRLDAIPDANFETIDAFLALGKKVMILTSRTLGELEHVLVPEHQLQGRVTAIYHRDNMRYHKPDPRAFEPIEAEWGLKPKQCVYVGDSVSDAAASNGAGMPFIASLESGLRNSDDFNGYTVDAFVSAFPAVLDAVIQLDQRAV